MKKTVLLVCAVAAGSFGMFAQPAAAGDDSLMCTLAKKGIISPDSGPWCGPHNPG